MKDEEEEEEEGEEDDDDDDEEFNGGMGGMGVRGGFLRWRGPSKGISVACVDMCEKRDDKDGNGGGFWGRWGEMIWTTRPWLGVMDELAAIDESAFDGYRVDSTTDALCWYASWALIQRGHRRSLTRTRAHDGIHATSSNTDARPIRTDSHRRRRHHRHGRREFLSASAMASVSADGRVYWREGRRMQGRRRHLDCESGPLISFTS